MFIYHLKIIICFQNVFFYLIFVGYTIQHRLDSDLTDLIFLTSIRCGIFNYDMLHVTISDGCYVW